MPGLAGQQIAIELPHLQIGRMRGQQSHALVAAGLDQTSHQKRIQHALGLLTPHGLAQLTAIGRSGQGTQNDAAALQQGQDALEMLQLFPRQRAEQRRELLIAWIAEHQLQGRTRRLALAVGVIDQHQIGTGQGLLQPGRGAGGGQPADPCGGGLERGNGHGWARRWATRPSRARP